MFHPIAGLHASFKDTPEINLPRCAHFSAMWSVHLVVLCTSSCCSLAICLLAGRDGKCCIVDYGYGSGLYASLRSDVGGAVDICQ